MKYVLKPVLQRLQSFFHAFFLFPNYSKFGHQFLCAQKQVLISKTAHKNT